MSAYWRLRKLSSFREAALIGLRCSVFQWILSVPVVECSSENEHRRVKEAPQSR
jgi:hypothetical protein